MIELTPNFSDADRQPEEVRLIAGAIPFHQGDRGELISFIEFGLLEVNRELAEGAPRCWHRRACLAAPRYAP